MALLWPLLRLAVASGLVVLAHDWRDPQLADIRAVLLPALVLATLGLIMLEIVLWRRRRPAAGRFWLAACIVAVSAVALVWTLGLEARFRWERHVVLTADADDLAQLGRHIVVGYRDGDDLRRLIERRAIGGVFLAGRNIVGRSAAAIAGDITAWQEIRRRQGLPPLWISADQEGGLVARLSPPLPRKPPLARVVAARPDAAARQQAVRRYAAEQAEGLRSLGVNLNLAPVVDLDHGIAVENDRYSLISRRAIGGDPGLVGAVASTYCAALEEAGVQCTLKHFPGLGRIRHDTHLEPADLDAAPTVLAASDWVPFRTVIRTASPFMMLGHVRITALDRRRPASFSRPVVDGLIRTQWRFDGVLITDDMTMGAVYDSPDGIAGASVAALEAGVDLVLVAFDTDQYYAIMNRLLRARAAGRLDADWLEASDRRLTRAAERLQKSLDPAH